MVLFAFWLWIGVFSGPRFPSSHLWFGNQASSLVDGPVNSIDCGSCFYKLDVNL